MRNLARFPVESSFIPTDKELIDLMLQIGRSKDHGGRRKHPPVFTEHGALMAANVLNSKDAINMSVFIIRAFIKSLE